MAIRPVFMATEGLPLCKVVDVEFVWSPGLAKSQSQKNIRAIHEQFLKMHPECRILEVSSKAPEEHSLGVELSAFNLQKYVKSLGVSIPVECAYQGSKVFELGGPYTDLFSKSPREAKTDERLKNSGTLIGFRFEGVDYPLSEMLSFYDILYISALRENPVLSKRALEYSAFTDICFSPSKGKNCQAKALAIFKTLQSLTKFDDSSIVDEDFDEVGYIPEYKFLI